jgi:hypothetical protein
MVAALSTQKPLTSALGTLHKQSKELQLIYQSLHLFTLMPLHTTYPVWDTTQDNPIVRA